jgi:trimeric autotransporter adhesin
VVDGEQEFTSFGASLGGFDIKALGEYSDAWGYDNTASGDRASVGGGSGNTADGASASVSGGGLNRAAGRTRPSAAAKRTRPKRNGRAVLGGFENIAKGKFSTVVGGGKEEAEHEGQVVP